MKLNGAFAQAQAVGNLFIRQSLGGECEQKATGNSRRQEVVVKQDVEQTLAKKIVKDIKDSKLKVQVSIQGDELRVSGKKGDDLQEAIAFVKGLKIEEPLQFTNFRD